jgi:hypothetical protein
MQILYDNKDANRSAEWIQLILLNSGWHVVRMGYPCRVDDREEVHRVIAKLRPTTPVQQLSVDNTYDGFYTLAPAMSLNLSPFHATNQTAAYDRPLPNVSFVHRKEPI